MLNLNLSELGETEAIRAMLIDSQKRTDYYPKLHLREPDVEQYSVVNLGSGGSKMEERSPEAQFRYAATEMGTEFEVEISGWKLSFNLSRKYAFNGEMTELSGRKFHAMDIGFQISLRKNLADSEWENPTVNDITVRVEHVPQYRRVVGMDTMFKEFSSSNTSLTLRISSEPPALSHPPYDPGPFEFGFDFDLNPSSHNQTSYPATFPFATHLIFSCEEFPDYLKTMHAGQMCPEYAIRRDAELKGVDAFVSLESGYWMRVYYGGIAMYRLAAVGHKLDPKGRKSTVG